MDTYDFYKLCREGNLARVKAAIDAGFDVNERFHPPENDSTVLIGLVEDGDCDPSLISMLINAGADVNARNRKPGVDWPVLLGAVIRSSEMVISMLLKAGADVNTKSLGVPVLISALLAKREPSVISTLINAGADVNAKEDESGFTPIMRAIHNVNSPQLEIIRTLINAGADVNVRNNSGETVLMFAAQSCNAPKVIATLLDAGAEINAQNDDKTALDFALGYKTKSDLRDSPLGYETALELAFEGSFSGREAIIMELVKRGARTGAYSARVEKLKEFAECVNESLEKTMLLVAYYYSFYRQAVVALAGALDDRAPLSVITALIERNKDINASQLLQMLHVAARKHGEPAVLEELIKIGADINARDANGYTALMHAATEGKSPAVIHALIKAGADANVRDNSGKRAIDLLGENGSLKNTDAYKQLKAYTEKDTANLYAPEVKDASKAKSAGILPIDNEARNWDEKRLLLFFETLNCQKKTLDYALTMDLWEPDKDISIASGAGFNVEATYANIEEDIANDFGDEVIREHQEAVFLLSEGQTKIEGKGLLLRRITGGVPDYAGLYVIIVPLGLRKLTVQIYTLYLPQGKDVLTEGQQARILKQNSNPVHGRIIRALRDTVQLSIWQTANPPVEMYSKEG